METEKKVFEIKAENLNDLGEFIGIASFYGNVDHGNDKVIKGAFSKSLMKNKEVVMLWQHDIKSPIGLFEVEDSEDGLIAYGKINLDVEKGREAFALLKQGAIKGLSIGYFADEIDWEGRIRVLKEIDLKEISLVTFPMNELSNVELGSVKSDGFENDGLSETFEEIKNYLKNSILHKQVGEIEAYIKNKNKL